MLLSTLAGLALWPLLVFAQNQVKVDDRDPSIQYSPPNAWINGGELDEYNGTTTFSLTAYAQFEFSFHGVGVQVIGTLSSPATGPVSGPFTYSLNGGAEQSGFAAGPRTPGVVLIDLKNLIDGPNTIVVRNGGPAATKFVLDAIQYTTLTPTQSPTTAGPTATAAASSTPATPVALIAGAAVGGVCGLGLLILLAFLLRRRCYRRQSIEDAIEPYKTPEPDPLARPSLQNGPGGWSPSWTSHTMASSRLPTSASSLSYDTSLFNYLDGSGRSAPSSRGIPSSRGAPSVTSGGKGRIAVRGPPAMTPALPPGLPPATPGLPPVTPAPPYEL